MFGTMRVVRWYDLAIFSVDGVYVSGMGETHVCLDDPSVAAGKISRRALRGDYGRLRRTSTTFFEIDVDFSRSPQNTGDQPSIPCSLTERCPPHAMAMKPSFGE
jgi:hypothetical protein